MADEATRPDLTGLSIRQKRFVDCLLAGASAADAARQAGYSCPKQLGSRLQNQPLIRAAIEGRLSELKLSADALLAHDSEIAKAPWGDYATTDRHGRVVYDLKALIADGYGFCIKGVKETKFGQVVEFEDPAAARERLERHHGLFKDQLDVSGEVTVKVLRGVSLDDL